MQSGARTAGEAGVTVRCYRAEDDVAVWLGQLVHRLVVVRVWYAEESEVSTFGPTPVFGVDCERRVSRNGRLWWRWRRRSIRAVRVPVARVAVLRWRRVEVRRRHWSGRCASRSRRRSTSLEHGVLGHEGSILGLQSVVFGFERRYFMQRRHEGCVLREKEASSSVQRISRDTLARRTSEEPALAAPGAGGG